MDPRELYLDSAEACYSMLSHGVGLPLVYDPSEGCPAVGSGGYNIVVRVQAVANEQVLRLGYLPPCHQ